MVRMRYLGLTLLALFASATTAGTQAAAQQSKKPNILFIMGDDIGLMQVGVYHRGLAVGETPNIDRIANEGGNVHRTTTPCRAAPPGATCSSPACIRCARA